MPSQSGRGRALDASENTLTDPIWPAREKPRRRCWRHIRRPVNNNRIGAILDRKLDVGVADGNLVHFAAVRACDVQGLLPGGGQAFCVRCDLCRGSPFGIGASEEKRSHITLPAGFEALGTLNGSQSSAFQTVPWTGNRSPPITSLSQTTNRGGVYRIGSREIGLHLASLEPCDSLLPWDALLTGGSDSSWVFRMGNKSAQSAFPHRR
jgi:hypothetical protein